MSEVIFSTIHGSHLYGMEGPESDLDYFTVTSSPARRARHSMNRETGIDSCRMGFDTFIRRCFEGSHQSVEALFSPFKVWNQQSEYATMLQSYISGLHINGSAVYAKYERTIKRFCYGDFKRRRHAVRLSWNLSDLRYEGRFNPVMTVNNIMLATAMAETLEGDELWERLMN